MLQDALLGTASGAAGTVALDAATYLDMAIRGRPSSEVPAKMVGTLAHGAGVSLSEDGPDSEKAKNRRSGLGALSGYLVGLGIGTIYGVVRPHLGNTSKLLAGVTLGLAAMAASDVPATATHATDPKSWGATGWAADLIPHLAYGLVTVLTYEAFAED